MDIFDVNISMRQAIIENYIVGESTETEIPDFSPMGHKKYVHLRDIFIEKLNGWKNGIKASKDK